MKWPYTYAIHDEYSKYSLLWSECIRCGRETTYDFCFVLITECDTTQNRKRWRFGDRTNQNGSFHIVDLWDGKAARLEDIGSDNR